MAGGISVGFSSKLLVLLCVSSLCWKEILGNLVYAGCDKNGWKCISSKVKTDKYDLEFDCNGTGYVVSTISGVLLQNKNY